MSTRLGRPTVAVVLSDDERETLERWARRPTSAQAFGAALPDRARCAEGTPNTEIAAALGCHPVTAGKWRRRFAQRRLDGLSDEPRPGAPRTISDAQIEAVIVKTLEEQPHNATQWSTRSMAAAVGMSQTAISKIWRAFGLKHTSWSTSSCRRTRSSSTRCATWLDSISTHRRQRSSCVLTRRPRSRHSTAPPRCCR